MLVGMGTVFVFLTLLVFATILMSRLVAHFGPVAAGSNAQEAGVSSEEVAAISAAITRHRRRSHSE